MKSKNGIKKLFKLNLNIISGISTPGFLPRIKNNRILRHKINSDHSYNITITLTILIANFKAVFG